jgi:hypothetical protein
MVVLNGSRERMVLSPRPSGPRPDDGMAISNAFHRRACTQRPALWTSPAPQGNIVFT